MPTCRTRIIMAVLMFLTVAAPTSAAGLGLDWKVTFLSPASGAVFPEKSAVKIRCEWNAAITADGAFDKPVEWVGLFAVDGSVIHYFTVKYEPQGGFFIKPGTTGGTNFPWEHPAVFGTATNQFHGAAESTWTAAGPGTHTVGCTIAMKSAGDNLESESKKANNSRNASIVVNAMRQVTPGRFPNPPEKMTTGRTGRAPQKSTQPIVPKPSLSIVGAEAKYDPSCSSLGNLVTVQVQIQDAGLSLAAGKGTVAVKENGGANLLSTAVALPAFAVNEAKVVQMVVGTLSQFAAALPGQHQLRIVLNPEVSGGQPSFVKPASDYVLPLTLPAGYCSGR